MSSTYSSLFSAARKRLSTRYDTGEAAAIVRLLFDELIGLSYTAGIVSAASVSRAKEQEIDAAVKRLEKGEPVQYVLGFAYFLGQKLLVTPDVLIPRPETEELVAWVLKDWREKPEGLAIDIGAGSGCIPVALKAVLTAWTIAGLDRSNAALSVLSRNASALRLDITAIQCDFLNESGWEALPVFDVIISNPPYIPQKEASTLHDNVRNYEPHMALFVPDDDPFLFYQKLADFAGKHLQSGGALYCETHANGAGAVAALWEARGFNTAVQTDNAGKYRMVKGWKEHQ